jgi:hypothetical protein
VAALIQNLNVLTARQLEDKERDQKKSSMTSQMSPETAKIFTLLLAKNWSNFLMFRPSYIKGAHNPKMMEQSIRELFTVK